MSRDAAGDFRESCVIIFVRYCNHYHYLLLFCSRDYAYKFYSHDCTSLHFCTVNYCTTKLFVFVVACLYYQT